MDTGVGLPEDRERLTEPYMTTRVRGTGLGLAIVKKIVEEHMGEIAFLDRAGGGTHVRISFDAEQLAALEAEEGEAVAAEQQQPRGTNGAKARWSNGWRLKYWLWTTRRTSASS